MVQDGPPPLAGGPSLPRFQFGLLALLAVVTACAVLAALVRLAAAPPWLPESLGIGESVAAGFFASICLVCLVAGARQAGRKRARFVVALCGAIGVLALLLFSATAAWHTVGLDSLLHWIVVPAALVPPFLCAARRYVASIAVSLLVAALTSPLWSEQFAYVARLKLLRAEVAAIAEHVESVKRRTGVYPSDLSGYDFQYPMFEALVEYLPPDSGYDGYVIVCDLYEGDPTDRAYGPRGGWYYCPD